MDEPAEDAAIDTVIDRIATRFPTIDRERIRSLVDAEAGNLDDATVREFIPVLVEHRVMEELRAVAEPVPLDDEDVARGLDDDEDALREPADLDPYEIEAEREGHSGFLFGDLASD